MVRMTHRQRELTEDQGRGITVSVSAKCHELVYIDFILYGSMQNNNVSNPEIFFSRGE